MATLRGGLAPFASREIGALTRKDLVSQIDRLEDAGLPGAATDLRSHSRAWLEWAVSQGVTQYNVLAGMRRQKASRAERLDEAQKGHALTDDQIRSLWASVATLGPF